MRQKRTRSTHNRGRTVASSTNTSPYWRPALERLGTSSEPLDEDIDYTLPDEAVNAIARVTKIQAEFLREIPDCSQPNMPGYFRPMCHLSVR